MATETVTIRADALSDLLSTFANDLMVLQYMLQGIEEIRNESSRVAAIEAAGLMAGRLGLLAERAAESYGVKAPRVKTHDAWALGAHVEDTLAALRPE